VGDSDEVDGGVLWAASAVILPDRGLGEWTSDVGGETRLTAARRGRKAGSSGTPTPSAGGRPFRRFWPVTYAGDDKVAKEIHQLPSAAR